MRTGCASWVAAGQPAEAPSPSHRPDSRAPDCRGRLRIGRLPAGQRHCPCRRRCGGALRLRVRGRRLRCLSHWILVGRGGRRLLLKGGQGGARFQRRHVGDRSGKGCRAVAWHRQIVGGFAGRGKIGGGGRSRHSRLVTGCQSRKSDQWLPNTRRRKPKRSPPKGCAIPPSPCAIVVLAIRFPFQCPSRHGGVGQLRSSKRPCLLTRPCSRVGESDLANSQAPRNHFRLWPK